MGIRPSFTVDRLRGLMQWWFKDADGAKRSCDAGPMPPIVCVMDRPPSLILCIEAHRMLTADGRGVHDVRSHRMYDHLRVSAL